MISVCVFVCAHALAHLGARGQLRVFHLLLFTYFFKSESLIETLAGKVGQQALEMPYSLHLSNTRVSDVQGKPRFVFKDSENVK